MAQVTKIVSDRLILDGINPEGLSANYLKWMNDPQVLRFLDNPTGKYDAGSLKQFVASMNASPNNYLFGIFLKDDLTHIGNIKLGNVNARHHFADLGLVIGLTEHWGKGYATEAITLVTRYAFEHLKLNKVIAGVLAANEASYRAFIKAGYQQAGKWTKHYYHENQYVDSYLMECNR